MGEIPQPAVSMTSDSEISKTILRVSPAEGGKDAKLEDEIRGARVIIADSIPGQTEGGSCDQQRQGNGNEIPSPTGADTLMKTFSPTSNTHTPHKAETTRPSR
jgi:hypothetical protein